MPVDSLDLAGPVGIAIGLLVGAMERVRSGGWKAVVDRVARNQVELGMTAEQARASWGRPSRFRREGNARTYCYDFLCTRSIRVVDQVVVDVQQ